MATIDVHDAPGRNRYEARIDGELVGFAEYQRSGDRVLFTHTEVEPRVSGQGVGSALVRGALDDVRAGGPHRVVPLCPFVRAWITAHAEYADLVVVTQSVEVKE